MDDFALRGGKRRFAELRRDIGGITEKMLIQTLRNLERDGIVDREVYPTVPPKVEYNISKLGRSLAPVLDAIVDWSHGNLEKVFAARAAYEKKKAPKKTESAPTRQRVFHSDGAR
jgi:DNA-binding HxlR family transcriptional regulator